MDSIHSEKNATVETGTHLQPSEVMSSFLLSTEHRLVNDAAPLAAVLLGIKPGNLGPPHVYEDFFTHAQKHDPHSLDLIHTQDPKSNEKLDHRVWLVHKQSVVDLVTTNSGFFGAGSEPLTYEQSKNLLFSKINSPNQHEQFVATGLLYGYPPADCDTYADVMPILKHVAGFPDTVKHLQELGFSHSDSLAIDKLIMCPVRQLRSYAVKLMRKKMHISEKQRQAILDRKAMQDHFGSTFWVSFSKDKRPAQATIEYMNKRMSESGMGEVLKSYQRSRSFNG